MKKYNLSAIMKRAWELVKKAGMKISSGLKKAWEEAKMVKKTFADTVRILRDNDVDNGNASDFLTFNLWEKGGKKRVYINDYKRRTIGYLEGENFVEIDSCGNTDAVIEKTINDFKAVYTF